MTQMFSPKLTLGLEAAPKSGTAIRIRVVEQHPTRVISEISHFATTSV
jgi:hypothetical protein